MRTRKLSFAALGAAMLTAVILSLTVQPVSQVAASYRADPGCVELVKNAGFETVDQDWTISTTEFPADYSTDTAHSGVRSMRLGIPPGYYDRWAWSSVYQDVTIPFEAATAKLSFWYKPYTDDTSEWDSQGMILYDTYWNRLDTVLDVLSDSGTWTYREWDVSSYAGDTVRLYFYVDNNRYYLYGRTWMYVDDVSLEWCREGEPGPTEAQLGFDPREKSVYPHGGPFEMSVVITDVADLGAFEFDISYDPEVVLVEGIQLEDFLERTGRIATTGFDDSLKLDGTYSFWAYTLPPGSDLGRPGPSGSGVLVTTFLSPVDTGETDLTLENVILSDTDADAILPSLVHGYVIVGECVGDLNHDGVVDIVDVMTVAANWGCEDGVDECYDEDYDLNSNGVIDVGDIMAVIANWGVCEAEEDTSILLQAPVSAEAAGSVMKIEPRDCSVGAGDFFTVSVVIEDAADLGGFQFDLIYDPDMFQVVEDPTLGDFLGSTGRQVGSYTITRDNVDGLLEFAAWSTGASPGPSGDGVLAEILVKAEWVGEGTLQLEEAKWTDTQANPQVPFAQGADVTVEGSYMYLPLVVKP